VLIAYGNRYGREKGEIEEIDFHAKQKKNLFLSFVSH